MSFTLSNQYLGLAQGSIDHKSSTIADAICGDSELQIGDVVRILPQEPA